MSAFALTMPRTTLTMDEGRVVRWRKKPGEAVKAGEVVAEVETDKSVVEVEAAADGYLRRILVAEGEAAPVGATLALFTPGPDDPLEAGSGALPAEAEVVGARAGGGEPQPQPAVARTTEAHGVSTEVRASPAVRREARRRGIDLRGIPGSGPQGRILLRDLHAYLARSEAVPQAEPEARQAVRRPSAMRQAIARAMTESWRTIPQFSVTRHVDMQAAETFRRVIGPSFEASRGVRLAVTDLLVQAVARTLTSFPNLNQRVGPSGEATPAETVDIGLAVAVDDGLLVPVLRDVASKPLSAIAVERRELTARALEGRLRAQDLGGATFTISNLGPFGIDQFRAIVNPGEVAILAVGRQKDQPRVVDGQVVVRPVLTLTLSVDHRVSDGAEAARFLNAVAELLEASDSWILF